jgi:DNA-binding NarL/FixJ family response regulator
MASRVAVQQQQRLFREGLRQLLGAEGDLELCGTAATGPELLALCEVQRPDLVLIEADATVWDVSRLCVGLHRTGAGLRVIGLSAGPATAADISRARRHGMSGLVSRASGIAGILAALRGAVGRPQRGQITSLPGSSAATGDAPKVLTPRELHVLRLVGAGYTSREISGRLAISHKTVENHKQRLFAKLGVQNQAHAVSVAMRTGLLRPDQVIDLAVGD